LPREKETVEPDHVCAVQKKEEAVNRTRKEELAFEEGIARRKSTRLI